MDESLVSFVESTSAQSYLRVQENLGSGYVRLQAGEAQRRQALQDIRCFEDIVVEMLRNARDAQATAIFAATWTANGKRYLTMLDNGSGIPGYMHEAVFEPFVTSKLDTLRTDRWGVHGRGMALYSIKQNTEVARVVASELGLGSIFAVRASLESPGEKKDQSTVPTISKAESGAIILKGPHNIVRKTLEFAIDERKQLVVYLGSPAEIAATLYHFGLQVTSKVDAIFSADTSSTPYIARFAYVEDAAEFARLAEKYELPLSERSARRILSEEIPPIPSHLEAMLGPAFATQKKSVSKHVAEPSTPAIRVDSVSLHEFEREVTEAFEGLAQANYLQANVQPKISVRNNELTVRISLERE